MIKPILGLNHPDVSPRTSSLHLANKLSNLKSTMTRSIVLVDSLSSLVSLLYDLENQPTSPPSFYLDIEGIRLSRHGSISIIQLFHLPLNRVFLIDIFILQEAAFDTANLCGTTLRSILESPTIPKVFFDVRNDADALYAHFKVSLQNVHDIQLLEVATRSRSKDRVSGLGSCIRYEAGLSVEAQRKWKATKERGMALFSEQDGGSYEVFNVRPMLQDIIDYCVQDTVHLPILWEVYSRKISKYWLQKVQEETRYRVLMSQTDSYEPHGEHKVWSPWVKIVKEGTKSDPRKSRGKPIVENRILAVGETEQGKRFSLAEVSAAKALHRQAEKQLREDLTRQSPAGIIKPRASKPFADFLAAQTSPTVSKTTIERPFPPTHLPTRSKNVPNATVIAKVDTEITSTMPDNEWACTTCSRKMLKSQQQDHRAGKAHINRLKQISSAGAASEPPLQATTAKKDPPQAATTVTARNQDPKPKPRKAVGRPVGFSIATRQGHPRSAGSKNKKLRGGPAVTSSSRLPEPPAHPSWGLFGFGQSGFAVSYEYDEYCSKKGDSFGLCDKDCGWCGHCMDHANI